MTKKTLDALRTQIMQHKLDGFVIPSTDFFQNEYTPDHLNRLKFITSFSGSNGVAIITTNKAVFFTDGRYMLQASKELDKEFEILDMHARESCAWFDIGLKKNAILGYDPNLHTKDNLAYYQKLANKHGFTMQAVDNLVDKIWQREEPIQPAFILHTKYAGKPYASKIQDVIAAIEPQASYLLLSHPDEVCWLLNIRGHDIAYTPLLLACAILHRTGEVMLFVNPQKMSLTLEHTSVYPLESLRDKLIEIANHGKVQLDTRKTPVSLLDALKASAIDAISPVEMMKAQKNATEIRGMESSHNKDGIAIMRFIYWLFHQKQQCGEYDAAQQLLEFRECGEGFLQESFPTISAYGPNASIIHYRPQHNKDLKIDKNALYLLDSGAHYYGGTTDVTRTLHLGKPTKRQKQLYTLVLKGLIALSSIRFPRGTTGANLDVLARQYLWQHGLNYPHSTGHGVGHCLSVHEGPQRISQGLKQQIDLRPGMIISNEPGYYEDNNFGIRLENLMIICEVKNSNYLYFKTLTKVPFQANLINYKMLTTQEQQWLKTHQQAALKLCEGKEERSWLKKYCKF